MDLRAIFEEGLKIARQRGLDRVFFSGMVKKSRAVSVYQGETDSLEIADEIKQGVWVECGGRWACASFENASRESLEKALEAAAAAARCNEPDPDMTLGPAVQGGETWRDPETEGLGIEDLKQVALSLEHQARASSGRVTHVPLAGAGYEVTSRYLRSSEGVDVLEKISHFQASLSVMAAGKDGRTVNAHESDVVLKYRDFDREAFVREVAGEAVSRVEPRGVSSGEYHVIFDPRMAAQLLATFWPVFGGDFLYKGLTRLEGRVGQKIASAPVTLVDQPGAGLGRHAFDAEGGCVRSKKIIEEGMFRAFLHNRYTARKAGDTSTGNAAGGLESLPGLSPANISWEGREIEAAGLLSSLSRGILIKELHGASASPISGDFSYGALGYWVENGRREHPVADFTIAGNFFDLLMRVEAVGNDLRYFSPHPMGSFGGRSLLVSSLTVSG